MYSITRLSAEVSQSTLMLDEDKPRICQFSEGVGAPICCQSSNGKGIKILSKTNVKKTKKKKLKYLHRTYIGVLQKNYIHICWRGMYPDSANSQRVAQLLPIPSNVYEWSLIHSDPQ